MIPWLHRKRLDPNPEWALDLGRPGTLVILRGDGVYCNINQQGRVSRFLFFFRVTAGFLLFLPPLLLFIISQGRSGMGYGRTMLDMLSFFYTR